MWLFVLYPILYSISKEAIFGFKFVTLIKFLHQKRSKMAATISGWKSVTLRQTWFGGLPAFHGHSLLTT